jgi:PAS domain S-box-containing protein
MDGRRPAQERLPRELHPHHQVEQAAADPVCSATGCESEEKFRMAFENAVDAIIWADPSSGRITNCNKAAETLLRRPREQIIGQHQTSLHPPHKAEHFARVFDRHIEQRGSLHEEAEVIDSTGRTVPVSITASLASIGGRPTMQGIFRDITEQKKAAEREKKLIAATARAETELARAEELRQAYAELARSHQALKEAQEKLIQASKLAAVGRFAAGVAHEMNNPLIVLLGYVSLLEEKIGRLPHEVQSHLDGVTKSLRLMRRAGRRCSAVAKNLLAFTYTPEMDATKVQLSELLQLALDAVAEQAREQKITVTCRCPDRFEVWGNATQLQQVFSNIINNAVQAMKHGGRLTVVGHARRDGACEIEITDTGPGIPPAHLNKVFDPFFTTKTVGEGTGLGLSIVHGIVKSHGGDVEARSRAGQQTTFRVVLPARPPSVPPPSARLDPLHVTS